jgi:hypothetical protein
VTIDRPLKLGELFAETVRLYGERIGAVLGLGIFLAGALVAADATGHVLGFVAILSISFTLATAAAARIVSGDAFREAWAQVGVRLPVLSILTVVVSVPFVIGRIDPLLFVFSVAWLGFTGLSIPVAVLERDPETTTWYGRLSFAMYRGVSLARAEYLHALGVVAALVILYLVLGPVLAILLAGFADNGRFAAQVIANGIIGPFFFLGLGVLYFEQKARALSSRGERTRRPDAQVPDAVDPE